MAIKKLVEVWDGNNIIKQNIDAMAAVKMNVLHLHLTEDQGFRIEGIVEGEFSP